ncbi:alpha/beta hydrolase [Stenotrophomonas maltophilia]|uniref:alpha/beta hydrolase n=1 Tax=Stenotrophomonas maltophilia TaxID=40324 RepID=UPI002E78F073|nr:alpha/beta hydrolase [Stenotrophomonas maltophilia]
MLLEPALQEFVDAVAAHALPEDLRELRVISESALPQLQGAPQAVAHVIEHTVIARDGHALELRFYTPEGLPDGPVPALLFAHGGGWFQCSLAVYDGPCRALANASGCVIAAVGYRLAPEHPFPVPLHDVADAWRWLQANADRLGLDPQRLAIGGDSAGGNLAAACCLLLRERGLPQPCHQLLLYPALDAGMGSDSYRDYATGYYLSAKLMQRCWQAYLGGLAQPSALASPAHATDLQGLAPATILSCEHDPLRDEAEQYAHRLQAAGVDCTQERLLGMIHACIHLQAVSTATAVAAQRAGDLLRQALS